MKSVFGILAGLVLGGIGAYGYINNLDAWGIWLGVGAIIIFMIIAE